MCSSAAEWSRDSWSEKHVTVMQNAWSIDSWNGKHVTIMQNGAQTEGIKKMLQ